MRKSRMHSARPAGGKDRPQRKRSGKQVPWRIVLLLLLNIVVAGGMLFSLFRLSGGFVRKRQVAGQRFGSMGRQQMMQRGVQGRDTGGTENEGDNTIKETEKDTIQEDKKSIGEKVGDGEINLGYPGMDAVCVENVSGTKLSDLVETYVAGGIPVMIWATSSMQPSYDGMQYHLEDGSVYTWRANEHCLVLCGYDRGSYYLMDPQEEGMCVAYERALVEKRYGEMGEEAVVIWP